MSDIGEAMQDYKVNATLWFGLHKGKPLKDVPKEYLKWVKTTQQYQKMSKSLKRAINFNINN